MAKLSKQVIKKHLESLEILKKSDLNFNDIEFVYNNYHEGAGKYNNLISAHFTPLSIAHSMTFNIRNENFVDLCAGIGTLSYAIKRYFDLGCRTGKKPTGICVENCIEYYEVGKKLLPEFHWINGSIFDQKVIDEIKSPMEGKQFSIISNPPYGKIANTDTKELLKYKGNCFEYKAIEIGALLGADDGAFLIPQNSCPFRMSGKINQQTHDESYKSSEYLKFVKSTEIEIIANIGFSTDVNEDESGWKDVSITTEIAIIEYKETDYKPIKSVISEKISENQYNLFA